MKLLKSELLKLVYQRRTYGLLLASIAISVLATAFTPYALTKLPTGLNLALNTAQAVDSVYAKALGGYMFVVIVGVYMMSSEFQHHTAIATFLATPKRSRALGAKLIVAVIAGAVMNLTATLIGMLSGSIALSAYKVTTQPDAYIWVDYPASSLLIGAVLAVIGVGIGTLIRNQNAAVTTAMLWLFLVDRLLAVLFTDIGKYLPTGLITAMMDLHIKVGNSNSPISINTSDYLDPVPAAGLLLLYGVVFAVASMLTTLRRDID